MSRWWRAYDEAVDDPKLILLTDQQHRAWFNLCCIASQSGGALPAVAVIAVKLRVKPDRARHVVAELMALGLIDHDGMKFEMHNWGGRQFRSDVTDPTNAERQKRYRNGKRNGTVTEKTVTDTVTAKRPESERTEAETEKKEDCRESVPTRYPEDFENGFWKPYPRTPVMSKKEALAVWKRLSPEDREKAIAAVIPYLAFLRAKPDHPAVHACRFLSQRRFDGFAAAPPPAPDGPPKPPSPDLPSHEELLKKYAKRPSIEEGSGLRSEGARVLPSYVGPEGRAPSNKTGNGGMVQLGALFHRIPGIHPDSDANGPMGPDPRDDGPGSVA